MGEGGTIYSNSDGRPLSFSTLSTGILTVSKLAEAGVGGHKKKNKKIIFFFLKTRVICMCFLQPIPATDSSHLHRGITTAAKLGQCLLWFYRGREGRWKPPKSIMQTLFLFPISTFCYSQTDESSPVGFLSPFPSAAHTRTARALCVRAGFLLPHSKFPCANGR